MIRCEHLTHIYGRGTPLETQALTDVSLAIAAGEFVGIIGATGSGKSTLVQHFDGLLRPTVGHVYLDGTDIHARGVDRRRIVYLNFEDDRIQPVQASRTHHGLQSQCRPRHWTQARNSRLPGMSPPRQAGALLRQRW